MRIDRLVRDSAEAITVAQHSDSARLDAELLLAHALEESRSFLYAHPEYIVDADQLLLVQRLIKRRCEGAPVAYLLGEKEFWSLSLSVDERVLIPRPETESIVEYILQLPLFERACVADLGTGSGAIALALAVERPSWFLVATDLSAAAIGVAKKNIQGLTVGQPIAQLALLRADWLSPFQSQCFDLIVSNPPYIDVQDSHLQQGDVRFEPLSALVSADKGYSDIKRISQQAKACLKSGGYLIMEHGYDQRDEVIRIVESEGYRAVVDCDDLTATPRFVIATKA